MTETNTKETKIVKATPKKQDTKDNEPRVTVKAAVIPVFRRIEIQGFHSEIFVKRLLVNNDISLACYKTNSCNGGFSSACSAVLNLCHFLNLPN